MKVAELIAALQKLPGDLDVVTYTDGDYLRVLRESPRVDTFYREDEPDEVFWGVPDKAARANGASAPFKAVSIGLGE